MNQSDTPSPTGLSAAVAAADLAIAAGDATTAAREAGRARQIALSDDATDGPAQLKASRRDWRMRILQELDASPAELDADRSIALREAFLALGNGDLPPQQHQEVLGELALIHLHSGRPQEATATLDRVPGSAAPPQSVEHARLLRIRVEALLAEGAGDAAVRESAVALANQSLDLVERHGNPGERAALAIQFGGAFHSRGMLAEARDFLAIAETIGRESARCSWRRNVLEQLLDVARTQEDHEELRLRYTQLLESYQPRHVNERARTLCQLASLCREEDRNEEADRHEAEAIATFERRLAELGPDADAFVVARVLGQKGLCHRIIGDADGAIEAWYEAVERFDEVNADGGLAWVAHRLASALREQERYDDARPLLERAIAFHEEMEEAQDQSDCMNTLALVEAGAGNGQLALQILGEAHEVHPNDGRAMYDIACILSLAVESQPAGFPPPADCRARALDALETAIREGWIHGRHIDGDSDLDPIRDDLRFGNIRATIEEGEPER